MKMASDPCGEIVFDAGKAQALLESRKVLGRIILKPGME